eukprot:5984808-Pyramimonas_sp.AAC.1
MQQSKRENQHYSGWGLLVTGSANTPLLLKAKPMLKEAPSLLEIVSEELSFRWESAKRGQWRPGSCSSDAYMNTDLRAKDREWYAAAGVLPYATTLSDGSEGLWLLMVRWIKRSTIGSSFSSLKQLPWLLSFPKAGLVHSNTYVPQEPSVAGADLSTVGLHTGPSRTVSEPSGSGGHIGCAWRQKRGNT